MDKYDEKADEIMIANGYVSSSMHKEIAAFGRECASQAYEDAAKVVYTQSRNRPADPDALAKTFIAKAASIQGAEEGKEKL